MLLCDEIDSCFNVLIEDSSNSSMFFLIGKLGMFGLQDMRSLGECIFQGLQLNLAGSPINAGIKEVGIS